MSINLCLQKRLAKEAKELEKLEKQSAKVGGVVDGALQDPPPACLPPALPACCGCI